jgi:hypothetical protein
VKDMWKRLTNPDILIYLDVSYPTSCVRRKMDWTEKEYLQEVFRLRQARLEADFYLDTDGLSIAEVRNHVLEFLRNAVGQSNQSSV